VYKSEAERAISVESHKRPTIHTMVHFSKVAFVLAASCLSASAIPTVDKRSGLVTLPLKYHAPGASAHDIVQADRLRARGSSGNVPATNIVSFYSAPIEIGEQTFQLLVDTGSSNTWVGVSAAVQHMMQGANYICSYT
jgi:hypothetical protein